MTTQKKIQDYFHKYWRAAALAIGVFALGWILAGIGPNKRIRQLTKQMEENKIRRDSIVQKYQEALSITDSIYIAYDKAVELDKKNRRKLNEYEINRYYLDLTGNELIDSVWSRLRAIERDRGQTDPNTWDGSRFNRPN